MRLIQTLAQDAGLSLRDVTRVVMTAPKRYKVFPIEKRGGGERMIAQPAVEVKALQSILVLRFLSQLPVHEAAYAYVRGKSIRQNALRHAHSAILMKLDFKNFFNSVRPMHLEKVLNRRLCTGIGPEDFEDLYRLAFWGEGTFLPQCLSVGAPSSPIISNIVMFDFDRMVSDAASSSGVVYTRYADDITFSGSSRSALLACERQVRAILSEYYRGIELNPDKSGIYGRGDRRMVTGLIITPNSQVSIGRERKRTIRAAVHEYVQGQMDDASLMRCKGLLAFVIGAEPSFLKTLIAKYGPEVIREILRTPQISLYRGDTPE